MTAPSETLTESGRCAPPPARFRAGEDRARRIGRTLRVVAGVREVDEQLMQRIGRAMNERDEPGHLLAEAIRMRAGEPGRVTMQQFQTALKHGLDAVPDAPAVLREFLTEAAREPDWLDWDLVRRGAAVQRRLGQNAADVLLQLSLLGGYRFGGPTDLLVATGGLAGDMTRRRLAETQHWTVELAEPDALRPGATAWQLTVHVRVMHALVNATFEADWDIEHWGYPINQADLAATLGLFDGVLLLGSRALGVPISKADSLAVMHLWRWVGHLLGVDGDFLVDRERERHRLNYHLLLAQGPLTEAGPQLAQAVLDAQDVRHFARWPARLQGVRTRFERERLLSMLTVFLGGASLREFGLPRRPPWAHVVVVVLNQWRYRILGRTPGGQARLETWGQRRSRAILDSYFKDEQHAVGDLR